MQRSLIAPMKTISIKLPDPLFQDLALRASACSSSRSEVVRIALAAYMKVNASAPAASCADRASRWTGIVKGPRNLATPPKNLRRFGQSNRSLSTYPVHHPEKTMSKPKAAGKPNPPATAAVEAVGPITAGLRGALLRSAGKAPSGKTPKSRADYRAHLAEKHL